MSLKDRVESFRQCRRPGTFLFEGKTTLSAVDTLFAYVGELEDALAEAKKPAPKKKAEKSPPPKEEAPAGSLEAMENFIAAAKEADIPADALDARLAKEGFADLDSVPPKTLTAWTKKIKESK